MKQLHTLLFFTLCVFFGHSLIAQDSTQTSRNQTKLSESSTGTHFLLSGYGFAGFEKVGDESSTFGPAGFAPIFLWQKSNRLFFEAEAEFEIEDGELNIGLEYATLHYRLIKNLTLGAGKFLSPFGIFGERLHPAWINKFAEKPLGFSHGGGAMVGPMGEIGVELRGGAQLGLSKINYVGYVTNGPKLNDGEGNPMMAGMLEYDNLGDNNDNKAVGGRIGLLPFSNSSFEIGVSGQFARVGDKQSAYENLDASMYAFDLSTIQKIEPLKSSLDIKAQYNSVKVGNANFKNASNQQYTFNNKSSAWFAQAALRPVFVTDNFFRNVEFAARFSGIKTPEMSMWSVDNFQSAFGINYWLDWNSVIKINFQRTKDKITGEKKNGFFIQWGLGL